MIARLLRPLRWLLLGLVAFGCAAMGSGPPRPRKPKPAPTFQPAEIEALVAPVALYPDSLLVAGADGVDLPAGSGPCGALGTQANRDLKGEAAVKAVESQPWDRESESLVACSSGAGPDERQARVDPEARRRLPRPARRCSMRCSACAPRRAGNGKLEAREQQKVIVESETVVRIEPADPQVIYVPTYDPERGLRRLGVSVATRRTTGRPMAATTRTIRAVRSRRASPGASASRWPGRSSATATGAAATSTSTSTTARRRRIARAGHRTAIRARSSRVASSCSATRSGSASGTAASRRPGTLSALVGKMNFQQVGLMGHSRGGGGVRAAYALYNDASTGWQGRIGNLVTFRGIFEIGPTDSPTPGRTLIAVSCRMGCAASDLRWRHPEPPRLAGPRSVVLGG